MSLSAAAKTGHWSPRTDFSSDSDVCVNTGAVVGRVAGRIPRGAAQKRGRPSGAQRFEAVAFRPSPAEAGAMDPQQWLLLELAYALLHATSQRRTALTDGDSSVFHAIESEERRQDPEADPRVDPCPLLSDALGAPGGVEICVR